jgi:branched-chain amino acid transport system substrate-binding protein
LVGFGLDTWYFITADYAFGWSLEENASSAVQAAGGRVIGRSRHPLDAGNFGEFLTAAQDSGAKVIALASAGGDTINAVKQAAEIGISPRSQTLVPLVVLISDVHSLGLDIAKGMTFVEGFYWDADSRTREWSKRFYARRSVMPTMVHAGVYSGVTHYLRAVQAAGTDDAKIVAMKMRQLRVDDFFARGGTGGWFMTCTSFRSNRLKNRVSRGTTTRSCRSSRETRHSGLWRKVNAFSREHRVTDDRRCQTVDSFRSSISTA